MINYIKNIIKREDVKQELGQIHDSIKEKTYLIQGNISILEKEIVLGTQFLTIIMVDNDKRASSYGIIPEIQKEITKQEKLARMIGENNIALKSTISAIEEVVEYSELKEEATELVNLQNYFIEKSYQRNNLLVNTIEKIMYSSDENINNLVYN